MRDFSLRETTRRQTSEVPSNKENKLPYWYVAVTVILFIYFVDLRRFSSSYLVVCACNGYDGTAAVFHIFLFLVNDMFFCCVRVFFFFVKHFFFTVNDYVIVFADVGAFTGSRWRASRGIVVVVVIERAFRHQGRARNSDGCSGGDPETGIYNSSIHAVLY